MDGNHGAGKLGTAEDLRSLTCGCTTLAATSTTLSSLIRQPRDMNVIQVSGRP